MFRNGNPIANESHVVIVITQIGDSFLITRFAAAGLASLRAQAVPRRRATSAAQHDVGLQPSNLLDQYSISCIAAIAAPCEHYTAKCRLIGRCPVMKTL